MKRTLLILMTTTSLNLLAADNYMIFIGGGGEPAGAESTQFDLSVKNFGNFISDQRKNYNFSVNFNGGHPKTETMIKEKFNKEEITPDFSKANFDKMVADYKSKLLNDEIKEGAKILIFINSHGAESNGETHKISLAGSEMTNLNSGSAQGMVSLDALKDLTKLAVTKKIKLAIVDASCHSGNSLSLANENTCVISGSGPKHYAFSNFPEVFAEQMMKGRNLEEVYLSSRGAAYGVGFPMISTPEGIEVQNEIYPLLTPYMYSRDEYRGAAMDKIDRYLKENARTYSENYCKREEDFKSLNRVIKLVEDVQNANKGILGSKLDLKDLKDKILKYREVQESYLKRLSLIKLPDMQKREKGYTHEQLIATNWNYFVDLKQKDLATPGLDDKRKKDLATTIEIYKMAQTSKEKILRDHPEYYEYQRTIDELKTDKRVNEEVASSIAVEAHKAYDAYYREKISKRIEGGKASSNPCKDFVL